MKVLLRHSAGRLLRFLHLGLPEKAEVFSNLVVNHSFDADLAFLDLRKFSADKKSKHHLACSDLGEFLDRKF